MLYLTTTLDPWMPIIDKFDISLHYKRARKYYHPDNTPISQIFDTLSNKPFIFLTQCRIALLNPQIQQSYRIQLHANLIHCREFGASENINVVK